MGDVTNNLSPKTEKGRSFLDRFKNRKQSVTESTKKEEFKGISLKKEEFLKKEKELELKKEEFLKKEKELELKKEEFLKKEKELELKKEEFLKKESKERISEATNFIDTLALTEEKLDSLILIKTKDLDSEKNKIQENTIKLAKLRTIRFHLNEIMEEVISYDGAI